MDFSQALPTFQEAARFHGHVCPGLAIGYRVATAAMELLEVERPHDEEIVAVVENDTCAVDAIQVVTGCTFGKGNLIFKDYGKGGFSFFSRTGKKAFRIRYKDFPMLSGAEGERMQELKENIHIQQTATDTERREYGGLRRKLIDLILACEVEKALDWKPIKAQPPSPARIRPSIVCERCGEEVMETRIQTVDGRKLCIPCAERMA